MTRLVDGELMGWPVSLMIERDYAHCCAYTGVDDEPAPDNVRELCESITDTCDGLTPARALAAAKAMGFIPEEI